MNPFLIFGLAATLAAIVGLSLCAGRKDASAKNSLPVVAGLIIGTLVGGSSTVGTAQLAYRYGLSAWWFTLGGGIGCLILALVYAVPLRRSGCPTLVAVIRREYGPSAGMLASLLSSAGTFLNIISQLISATAVLAVIAPALPIGPAVAFSACFMALYVVFGGTKGAGMVGIVKTILLYGAMMACGVMALRMAGGLSGFIRLVDGIENPEGVRFFSLFARGAGTDAGACLSLILGVLTTQTYAQAVLSGRTDRDGVGGALLSALLIPPIGAGGILVGLYMRANAALYPGLTAKTALTTFILSHVPPLLAGVVLGALFITVVGTGAGLALGIATILNHDVASRLLPGLEEPKKAAALSRIWIVAVLAAACLLSTGSLGDTILQFAFMSMGLRGAVVFVPLLGALWLPGRVRRSYALFAIVLGPAAVLVFGVLDVLPFDPLFAGVLLSLAIMAAGLRREKGRGP